MAQGESSRSQIGFDQIRLGKHIGEGTFGTVYEASVTLKVDLVQAAVKRFRNTDQRTYDREITQMLELQHENIVKIYGVSKNGNDIYLVMELAENCSVHDALYKSSEQPSLDQTWHWGGQCASGVAYLHDQEITHRDLKPHNCLLFDKKNLLKICDFGLARDVTYEAMTQEVRTLIYMAPEVIEGKVKDNTENKCDVYSWGLLYWEMHAHKRPFADKDLPALYETKKRGETPPPLVEGDCPGLDICEIDETNALLEQCWNKDPSQRPTMKEVEENLKRTFIRMKIARMPDLPPL